MYDILKSISEAKGWSFTYARKDYQNLFDEDPVANTPYLFLDPVNSIDVFGEFNEVVSTQYSGSFMILMSSDIDEPNYDFKYQKYIKPLIKGALKDMKKTFGCNEKITIESWGEVEVINAFDWTADGLIVTYLISEKV